MLTLTHFPHIHSHTPHLHTPHPHTPHSHIPHSPITLGTRVTTLSCSATRSSHCRNGARSMKSKRGGLCSWRLRTRSCERAQEVRPWCSGMEEGSIAEHANRRALCLTFNPLSFLPPSPSLPAPQLSSIASLTCSEGK